MQEIELKLAVPRDRLTHVTAEAHRASSRTKLKALYFDTEDRRLAKAGVSLRLRKEDRRWIQTVKLADQGAARRQEHNVKRQVPDTADLRPGQPGAEALEAGGRAANGAAGLLSGKRPGKGIVPPLDLKAHEGTPAGDALREALGNGPPELAELKEVFRTEVVRHKRLEAHAGGHVEVALDEGEIVAGARREPILEMEFELKSGSADAVFAVARQWMARHGLTIDGRAKADRGQCLSLGAEGAPPAKASSAPLRGVKTAKTAEELLQALVGSALHQVLANASEVAAGRESPDHVHQLRVGLRRMRTALRAFEDAAPSLEGVEPALAHVFRDLGTWRDAGVAEASIAPKLRKAGAPAFELPAGGGAHPLSPARLVRGAAFQSALLQLIEFADGSHPDKRSGSRKRQDLDKLLSRRLSKLDKQVRQDGERFEALPEEERHRVRKRLKRLRYLAEFVAPRYKSRAVKQFVAALEPAQEALGEHNDAVVAIERYRSAAETDPRAWFAVGWLTARLEDTAAQSRAALKAIGKAERFWA